MRLSLVAAVLVYSMTLTDLAFGGLVEVNSSQYIRESGNPQAQYLEVTLDNAGEIRVSNVNLQDGYIELAASTDVLLNGSSLMQPFSLPTGGSAVFPLEAGTHYLEVTLRGKPGGGLKVSFYEDKPDAPVQGKGWELLDDGTVLNRETGLIFHRNVASPGWGLEFGDPNSIYSDFDSYVPPSDLSISQYIDRLNSGFYGEDKIDGNAGHTDWRAPTINELLRVLDFRANPPLSKPDGSVGEALISVSYGELFGGMLPGDPLVYCVNTFGDLDSVVDRCDYAYEAYNFITNDQNLGYVRSGFSPMSLNFLMGYEWGSSNRNGVVWPVRGGTPE